MERRCLCCRKRFIPIRNPNQRYCAARLCQNKRRQIHEKKKLQKDPAYYETHQLSQKKWRLAHPAYWSHYRLYHPIYTQNNRLAQANRDRKRRLYLAKCGRNFMLANMYPLVCENNYVSWGYNIFLGAKTSLQICTL